MADGVEQLRNIYDLCSPDSNDFILTEILVEKLSGQFDDRLLEEIKGTLDPGKKGKISFDDFCLAIDHLNSGEAEPEEESNKDRQKKQVEEDEQSSSDPEFTYNEYDIGEEDSVGDMENFEAFGESMNTLSPIPIRDGGLNGVRNNSFRKSHRRNKSWAPQPPTSSHIDDSSSVSSEIDDLTEKVDILQSTVLKLTEEKTKQNTHDSTIQENHVLVSRVHELEEKLHDASTSFSELQSSSTNKYQSLRSKMEREKELEIQVLQGQLDNLKKDNERVQRETNELQSSRTELKDEVKSLRKMTEDLTQQLVSTNEQYRKLSLQFAQQQEKHDVERHQIKDELSEVCLQMDALQHEKNELEQRLESSEEAPGTEELRQQVDHLKRENQQLQSLNDDLEAELAQKISNVQSIIQENVPGLNNVVNSLADELNDASKDDLVERLHKQEQVNDQLKSYLDRLLQNILERDPGILEIKSASESKADE